jgi:hypothetical protein
MPFPTRCRTPWSLTLHGVRLSEALLAHVAQHERGAPASGPLQLLRVTPLFHFVRSERMSQFGAAGRETIIQTLHFETDFQSCDAKSEHRL